ncbi:hypothetical protein ILUMI_25272 [Ignelater luminosus]|uniref:Poly(A) RNA polymerase, mitochondrial n=1 Tax=Ignelater luminosus TaxID=2038154 RepID=A0A8K0C8Q4_IGNLU|nr:hypothetical protein ILUMI_25272 [Ignelater luminosus]
MLTNVVGRIFLLKNFRFSQNLNSNINPNLSLLRKWRNSANTVFSRRISLEAKKADQDGFVPFLEMMRCRRSEASKSVLVQVQSAQSYKELHSYCSTFGTVNNIFHYTAGGEQLHFLIVEFSKESEVQQLLTYSSHVNDFEGIPVQTNFLWFKASGRKSKLKQSKSIKLDIENGNCIPKEEDIREALRSCNNISEQISTLHNITTLNEVATRLRFLTARQVEMCLLGLFPNAIAYPFGSSVNGFGKMGCDLDLVLRLAGDKISGESRLVFHSKALNGYDRSISQRHMEVMGDLLQFFLPGCTQIRKILQARVPIIKYYQQLTDVECDLSMSNMSGVCMSDLLYMFGSIDERVRPLVFTIRKWAKEVGLTNSSPGRWITNFSMTLLVLAFLQQPDNCPPILPTFNTLIKNAGSKDKFVTEDGINCTFLRDIEKLKYKTTNTDNLESLLKQFCEFYSSFDFSTKAVCLNEAVSITKPEHSPLYIVNPLERGLNVSKNVSLEELEKFKYELRNATWILESQEKKTSNWGILEMFESKRKVYPSNSVIPSKQGRLMEVSKLFDDTEQTQESVIIKNENVEKEIQQIRTDTNQRIRNIGNNIRKVSRQKSRR